jgi:hypothetical protein
MVSKCVFYAVLFLDYVRVEVRYPYVVKYGYNNVTNYTDAVELYGSLHEHECKRAMLNSKLKLGVHI